MSERPFRLVERICRCGLRFDALAIWSDDVPCGRCSARRHADRMARAREGRSYSIDSLGGACPTQAEGRTADDRPYYFRARHGEWTLQVGEPGWPAYMDWPGRPAPIAEGDDPSDGFMSDEAVLSILDAHLSQS